MAEKKKEKKEKDKWQKKTMILPEGHKSWETWYPVVRDDPKLFGIVRVPKEFSRIPVCGCEQEDESLEIIRGRGEKVFRCNGTGCNKLLP